MFARDTKRISLQVSPETPNLLDMNEPDDIIKILESFSFTWFALWENMKKVQAIFEKLQLYIRQKSANVVDSKPKVIVHADGIQRVTEKPEVVEHTQVVPQLRKVGPTCLQKQVLKTTPNLSRIETWLSKIILLHLRAQRNLPPTLVHPEVATWQDALINPFCDYWSITGGRFV